MKALAIVIVCFIALTIVIAAVKTKRSGTFTLRTFIKHVTRGIMTFSTVVFVALCCLMSCYAALSDFLKNILSVNSVENIKAALRMLSGASSTFVALQTLAVTAILLSFVSCVAFIFGNFVFLMIDRFAVSNQLTIADEEEKDAYPVCARAKAFLLFSKLNS